MADRLGEQFYKRCPDDVMPQIWKDRFQASNTISPNERTSNDSDIENGKEKEKVQETEPPLPSENTSQSTHLTPNETTTTPLPQTQARSKWIPNPFRRSKISAKPTNAQNKKLRTTKDGKPNYSRIFFGAMHSTLLWRWWLAGLLKLIGGQHSHIHTFPIRTLIVLFMFYLS